MIGFVGTAIWVTALAILWLVFKTTSLGKTNPWPIIALFFLGMLLFCRPHEDIYGGQDSGVYLNNAITFLSRGRLISEDVLLKQIPLEDRELFIRRLRAGKVLSPGLSMRIIDRENALEGPWFQPLHALVAGVPAYIMNPRGTLYTTPLFALGCALLLGCLAVRLLPSPHTFSISFLLFCLNPVTLWHARSSRAEYSALFFLLAGCCFFLSALKEDTRTRDIWWAGVCVAIAPFLHITAWLLTGPIVASAGILALSRRRAFAILPAAGFFGVVMFYLQSRYITDCYNLLSLFESVWKHPVSWITGLLVAAGLWKAHLPFEKIRSATRTLPLVVGAGLLSLMLLACWHNPNLTLSNFPVLKSLHPSNMRQVILHIGLPSVVLAIAGWAALCIKGRRNQRILWLFACFLPGLLTMGSMPISMYFLRRTILFCIPLVCLGVTALIVHLLKNPAAWKKPVAFGMFLLTLGNGLYHRTHFATQIDHAGYMEFLEPYVEALQGDVVLLCEYDRIATTMKYFYGIPTLALGQKRRVNHERVFKAIEGLMQRMPSTSFYFLTPFDSTPPAHLFKNKLLRSDTFSKTILHENRQGMATSTRTVTLPLQLYSLQLTENPSPP